MHTLFILLVLSTTVAILVYLNRAIEHKIRVFESALGIVDKVLNAITMTVEYNSETIQLLSKKVKKLETIIADNDKTNIRIKDKQ